MCTLKLAAPACKAQVTGAIPQTHWAILVNLLTNDSHFFAHRSRISTKRCQATLSLDGVMARLTGVCLSLDYWDRIERLAADCQRHKQANNADRNNASKYRPAPAV